MSEINDTEVVKQQYANASNLNVRISIHDRYSTNKIGFRNWIVSNYRIDKGMKVLELGCGTGTVWKDRETIINSCSKLVLSDLSEGMVAAAKENLSDYDNIEYRVLDIQKIPYENETFDVVIANMMLHHVPDINKGLAEVRRILKKNGVFYCAAYGEHGITEYISNLLKPYGAENRENKSFTLQNGRQILAQYFSSVEMREYIDSLEVTNIDDMLDYVYSLNGMTDVCSIERDVIKEVFEQNMINGILKVPKEYGMFVCG